MDMSNNLLDIKDLVIQYRTDEGIVHAVEGLNMTLKSGESLGLVGETGAGKTTTALGIMGLIPDPPGDIVSGQINFKGEDLLKKSKHEMRSILGKEIAMIFQDPMTSLNPVMTVGKQIAELALLHQNVTKAEADEIARKMLETVGIKGERANDYPHQFSGGMKQRVVIAIALACNPKLIIADEPTTALDVTIQAQVLDLMKKLNVEFGTSMIMITHDLGVVAEICDKVAIMYAGNIVEYATKESLYTQPRHPYTQGLFLSIPDIDKDEEFLTEIGGTPPDPTDLPKGCHFSPRCKKASDRCKTEKPMNYRIDDEHSVKCFLYES